jgi:TRAP-type mannitol/chloroaromatic compound transport system permease small subunit
MTKLAYLLALPAFHARRLGGWLLLLLALVIGYDVIGRKFFNTGSVVLQDLEWHLHGAALLLGFAAAYVNDAHVRVDLFRERLRPRTKVKLELFGIVTFLIPYIAALTYFAVAYAHRAFVTGEGPVGGAGLPQRWIIKSVMVVGFVLILLAAMSVLLRCIQALRPGSRTDSPFDTAG